MEMSVIDVLMRDLKMIALPAYILGSLFATVFAIYYINKQIK